MTSNYDITISSPPDRERLVAEILFDGVQWAEVNQEKETLEVEFYARPDGTPWRVPLDVAVGALSDARAKLVGA